MQALWKASPILASAFTPRKAILRIAVLNARIQRANCRYNLVPILLYFIYFRIYDWGGRGRDRHSILAQKKTRKTCKNCPNKQQTLVSWRQNHAK